jgi:long-chain fatty acid transport protein
MGCAHEEAFMRRWVSAAAAAAALALSGSANANDGRSIAMGNTGSAFIDAGSAIYQNPALMSQIQGGAVTLGFAPKFTSLTTPLAGPYTKIDNTSGFSPVFIAGGAYRLGRGFVAGMAIYPVSALGATYEKVRELGGFDVKTSLYSIDFSPGVSYEINDYISVGAAWRISYTSLSLQQPGLPPGGMAPVQIEQSATGVSFLGAHLGALVRPTNRMRIGLTYRSKMTTDLSGTTKLGPTELDAETKFSWPHQLRAGLAYNFLEDGSLLLSVDARYIFYKESNKRLTVSQELNGTPVPDQTLELGWRDSVIFGAGGEYLLDGTYAFRAGYGVQRSQISPKRPNYTATPPTLIHSIHAGAGLKLAHWDVDLGGFFDFASKTVDTPQPGSGNPGEYKTSGLALALSGTFRFN